MDVIFRHVWVVFIAVAIGNYFILKSSTKKYIDKNPDLKTGYEKALKAMLIYGSIPWVIMAIGASVGQTNSVLDYFNPRSFNPFVLAFHLYLIIIWVLTIRWIYFKNGANFLVRHPGFIHFYAFGNSISPTPTLIKIFFALAILGGIAGMTMMWIRGIRTFPIK